MASLPPPKSLSFLTKSGSSLSTPWLVFTGTQVCSKLGTMQEASFSGLKPNSISDHRWQCVSWSQNVQQTVELPLQRLNGGVPRRRCTADLRLLSLRWLLDHEKPSYRQGFCSRLDSRYFQQLRSKPFRTEYQDGHFDQSACKNRRLRS